MGKGQAEAGRPLQYSRPQVLSWGRVLALEVLVDRDMPR